MTPEFKINMTSQFKSLLPSTSSAFKRRLLQLKNAYIIAEEEYHQTLTWLDNTALPLSEDMEALLCYAYLSSPEVQAKVDKNVFTPMLGEEILAHLQHLANQDVSSAQYYLGRCYYEGASIPENKRQAFHCMSLSAAQDEARAQDFLGSLYNTGEGVAQDKAKAMHYYTLSANQGFIKAQYHLGYMYDQRKGMVHNKVKAVHYYTLAAEQGFADAQFYLAEIYAGGKGVERDRVKAIEYYTLAAKQSHFGARELLAYLYAKYDDLLGFRGDADIEHLLNQQSQLNTYVTKARQGDVTAQYNLGRYLSTYKSERGSDNKLAIEFLTLAIHQGDEQAQCLLGLLYWEQECPQAIALLTPLADKGNIVALQVLAQIYYNGKLCVKDWKKAFDYFSRLAQQKDNPRQMLMTLLADDDSEPTILLRKCAPTPGLDYVHYALGVMCEKGQGTVPDIAKAEYYYLLAAEHKNPFAYLALARLYEKGAGVEQDQAKALYYYLAYENHCQTYEFDKGMCGTLMLELTRLFFQEPHIMRHQERAYQYCSRYPTWNTRGDRDKENYALMESYLCVMYEQGWGIAQDRKRAASLLTPLSLANVQRIYQDALQGCVLSLSYMHYAANNGVSALAYRLGLMYLYGKGVAQDNKQALHYLSLVNLQEKAVAACYLCLMYARGMGVEQNLDKAMDFYRFIQPQEVALQDLYDEAARGEHFAIAFVDFMAQQQIHPSQGGSLSAREQAFREAPVLAKELVIAKEQTSAEKQSLAEEQMLAEKLSEKNTQGDQYFYLLDSVADRFDAFAIKYPRFYEEQYNQLWDKGILFVEDWDDDERIFWHELGEFCSTSKTQMYYQLPLYMYNGLAIVAYIYLLSEEKAEDKDVILRWLQFMAKEGEAFSQFFLALCYCHGVHIEQNEHKAFFWMEQAATRIYLALHEIARFYYEGIGHAKDEEKAMALIEELSSVYVLTASWFNAIEAHKKQWSRNEETTVPHDAHNFSAYWATRQSKFANALKKAESGNLNAQMDVVGFYIRGSGVEADFEQAIYWLTKALEERWPDALAKVSSRMQLYEQCGLVILYGIDGFYKSQLIAEQCFEKAAEQGSAMATMYLGMLCQQTYPWKAKQLFEQAWESYHAQALEGSAKAQYALGFLYLNGMGCQKDVEQAMSWWNKAIEQNFDLAKAAMAALYSVSNEVEHDYLKARFVYEGDVDCTISLQDLIYHRPFGWAAMEDKFVGQDEVIPF